MIAFIDDHRAAYGVEPICRVLPIAPSTYYAHAAKRADPGKLSARARCDASLQTDIKRVWDAILYKSCGDPLMCGSANDALSRESRSGPACLERDTHQRLGPFVSEQP